jgi:hypothetical protein
VSGNIAFVFRTGWIEWSVPRPGRFPTRKGLPVPNEQQAGWAPEPAWTFRRREKCLALARNGMVIISLAVVKSVLVIYIENRLSEPTQVPLPCAGFIFCLVLFSLLYLMLILIMCESKNARVFYYNV